MRTKAKAVARIFLCFFVSLLKFHFEASIFPLSRSQRSVGENRKSFEYEFRHSLCSSRSASLTCVESELRAHT